MALKGRVAPPLCPVQGQRIGSLWELPSVDPESDWDHEPSQLVEYGAAAPDQFLQLAEELLARWREAARIEAVERAIVLLKDRVSQLEQNAPVIVPIETLDPEPYQLLKPFHAVVMSQDDEYVATWFDAGLSASGSTQEEAIFNLKDILVATWESLACHTEDQLAAGIKNQLRILREFVRKKP
jgi:hypothetical protein